MKTAIFAGSFDPPTLGHLDIIKRAAKLCVRLYVAVAVNESKITVFPMNERIEMLQTLVDSLNLSSVRVVSFSGLVVDFADAMEADTLIRGVRNCTDFDYECQMASANHALNGIETVCLIASPQYQHTSSTLIHEIAKNHGPLQKFVPKIVETELKKIYE